MIPDTPETRQYLFINDFAKIRELFDISLPGEDAEESDLTEYLKYLGGSHEVYESEGALRPNLAARPSIAGMTSRDDPIHRDSIGFDQRNFEQTVLVTDLENRDLEIIRGRFDPVATEQAINGCSECPSHDGVIYNGVKLYIWGEDLAGDRKLRYRPPAFDTFGRGGRIAVTDDYVFRTIETHRIEMLIDATAGDRPSLAEFEEFRLIAAALDELDVYGALISIRTQSLGNYPLPFSLPFGNRLEYILERLDESPLLRPYRAFATAIGRDKDGHYMALVLVHENEVLAQENVGLIEKRLKDPGTLLRVDSKETFAEEVNLRSVESQVDGRVLVAKLRGDLSRKWTTWYFNNGPLWCMNEGRPVVKPSQISSLPFTRD